MAYVQHRFAEYEASGSAAWDSTMDVHQRPVWLRETETKTFVRHKSRRSSHVLDHQPSSPVSIEGDEDAGDLISVSVTSSNNEPLQVDQIQELKRCQQAQMQALLRQTADLQSQQTQLLAQQEAQLAEQQKSLVEQQQMQRARQLELEHEHREQHQAQRARQLELERVQLLQQEALVQTEFVLEQQLNYLDSEQHRAASNNGDDLHDNRFCGVAMAQPSSNKPEHGCTGLIVTL